MPMPPRALALLFLAVMGAAVACFLRAFLLRRTPARHVRWAIAGVAIDLLGTVAVVVTSRALEWRVEPAFPTVAAAHRALAYVATGMVLLQAWSGAVRHRLHPWTGRAFLPVYGTTWLLALWAYGPWP
jgi:Kef-type K+ transport system membrane component KefB